MRETNPRHPEGPPLCAHGNAGGSDTHSVRRTDTDPRGPNEGAASQPGRPGGGSADAPSFGRDSPNCGCWTFQGDAASRKLHALPGQRSFCRDCEDGRLHAALRHDRFPALTAGMELPEEVSAVAPQTQARALRMRAAAGESRQDGRLAWGQSSRPFALAWKQAGLGPGWLHPLCWDTEDRTSNLTASGQEQPRPRSEALPSSEGKPAERRRWPRRRLQRRTEEGPRPTARRRPDGAEMNQLPAGWLSSAAQLRAGLSEGLGAETLRETGSCAGDRWTLRAEPEPQLSRGPLAQAGAAAESGVIPPGRGPTGRLRMGPNIGYPVVCFPQHMKDTSLRPWFKSHPQNFLPRWTPRCQAARTCPPKALPPQSHAQGFSPARFC